jgi:putative peptidoglycan lipid II flippase
MGTAALIVSAGVLISRILGQLREVIFASLLGANASTDEYVAAFAIPDFLNYLLAGGFLSITFIPILSRYLADDDEAGGWVALSAIIRPLAIGIVGLVAIGWFAAPEIIKLVFPRFSPDQIENTIHFTRIILPAQVFFVLGALFSAVQYTKGVFTIPTLAPIIYNLGIIIGGVGYALTNDEPSPEGFIWGALIGAFIGNFALQWWGARRLGMRLTMRIPWRHPVLKEYLLIAFPLMIGQSIVVLDETFMRVFGQFVSEGAATELNYARRTMLVPVGVVAQAAGVAAYPFLARMFAEGRMYEMKNTVDKTLRYVLVLSMMATALVAAMTIPIVRSLFERGKFSVESTIGTAEALFFYALAIPVWGGLQILNRAFYARRDMWTPVLVGTAATVAAVPLYIILQNSFGLRGIALASTLTLTIYTGILAAVWYDDADGSRRIRRLAADVGRAVPLAVIGGGAAFAVAYGLNGLFAFDEMASLSKTLVSILIVVAGTVAFAAVAVGLGSLLHDWLLKPGRASGDPLPVTDDAADSTPVSADVDST